MIDNQIHNDQVESKLVIPVWTTMLGFHLTNVHEFNKITVLLCP